MTDEMTDHSPDYQEAAEFCAFVGVDASFPEWGLAVVGYMDEDGNSRFMTKLYGASSATNLIGILHLVQQELMYDVMTAEVDEDDEV